MTVWTKQLLVATRLICALALMMVGFAHQPVVAQPAAVQFAAYVLPDGTLPTLCVYDDGSRSQPAKGIHDHGCDACRLAAAILMPEAPSLGAQAIAFSAIARTIERHYRLARTLYPPNSGPRAPPVSVILA
jgi:hypothetical protein